jgi:hypothetical protein
MLRLVIGFLPWIILAVLGNRWFALALVLALAAAAVTTVRQVRGRSLKILDTITFAFFLFVLVGVVGFRWMTLATYMSLLANATLTAIAWGSLLAGAPFTIQYAREQVAPEFWHSPLFIRTNQHITAVWGLDFFLSALGFALPAGFGRPEPGVASMRGFSFRWARPSSRSVSRLGTGLARCASRRRAGASNVRNDIVNHIRSAD